ncbi:MAG: glycosyltransferase family 2 protein [Acidobacteriota bacterium]
MKLSVIIPVRDGGQDFQDVLQALAVSIRPPDELIVVDDGSTDSSADQARRYSAHVIPLPGGPHGPAIGRNRGASAARGDVLVFLDADVAVHPDTLGLIDRYMEEQPTVGALFGSYDDNPPKRGFITRYKNLQHHYVHQHGRREASTFWAGCGAIRRDLFIAMGGFDEGYARPSIEDIELGVRLYRAGQQIRLCPDVQVAHLKRWTLTRWLRADIMDRAIPWTRLILSSARMPSDLNLDARSRMSALTAWLLVACALAGLWFPWAWIGALASVFLLVFLNADLYRFFARRGGLGFAVGAFGLHTLYYLYSSLVFGVLSVWHVLQRAAGAGDIGKPSNLSSTRE